MLKKLLKFQQFLETKKRKSLKIDRRSVRVLFTRERKLGFDKMMTTVMKKSSKSIQNSLNDTQLELGEDTTISNSAYT